MDKWISTSALYGDYLAHARTYSHKYIKREPDGHGGYRYWYPTDIRNERNREDWEHGSPRYFDRYSYSVTSDYPERPSNSRNREAYKASQIYTEGLKDQGLKNTLNASSRRSAREVAYYTNAYAPKKENPHPSKETTLPDKPLYKNKGIVGNYLTGENGKIATAVTNARLLAQQKEMFMGQPVNEGNSTNNSSSKPNIAQQTISSLAQTAKSIIDAGKKFLSSIFTNPITETYTIKDTNNKVIASGTRNSNLSEVGKDLVNAGKKWLSNIITTKKTITVTEK